jgi:hypothetical protein
MEEARKDSLRNGRVVRNHTAVSLFRPRVPAFSMGERETQDQDAADAREQQEQVEEAKDQMSRLEEGDPPEKLEDWPDGKAKYLTYGGPEGSAGYDEGPTAKLGPSSLEHHEDGSVSIEGEKVDNPDEYKTDPVPGAPGSGDDDGDEAA